VAARAAAALGALRCILVGDERTVRDAVRRAGARLVAVSRPADASRLGRGDVGWWRASAPLGARVAPGSPTAAAGAAQLRWIDQACDLVASGLAAALVTGPVSKQVIAASGRGAARRFRGHTEHLAARLGARAPVMAFVAPRLRTALVTTHLPLRRVPAVLRPEGVARACVALAHLVTRLDGARPPPIAVASLNPHAGEGGLLGDEERRLIAPGIERARARLGRAGLAVEIVGPMGAETAYRRAAAGEFGGVVAMYHDQATIACKLAGFGETVNVTLGLPIVRTSVDHGTAYDLAGTGRASDRAMRAALRLAARLAR
jgi:4-hydroxythreonine-4-phosphate dehydrogenase